MTEEFSAPLPTAGALPLLSRMRRLGILTFSLLLLLEILPAAPSEPIFAREKEIPPALLPWQNWATWDAPHRNCPTPYSDPQSHLCFWPSQLSLEIETTGGRFALGVTVYDDTWVPLPGDAGAWPQNVKAGEKVVPVLERAGHPAVKLAAGDHRIQGEFGWKETPRSLQLPESVGLLALTLDGQQVPSPSWDGKGVLWMKRGLSTGVADKDFLEVKVNALLEDGIPLWLHTEIELIVAGKSREEDLGSVLPQGWNLSAVQSPIPVVVDEEGRLKAQVRAGRWTIQLTAFRIDDPKEFSYETKPVVSSELIAFQAKPDFRMVEIEGAPSIDVSQTPFPQAWRNFPVYRWDTSTPFRLTERLRGMGEQRPEGLTIARTWWLDETGRALTFRDQITGTRQEIWRLDAAPGLELGSVRSQNEGQLITRNPTNNAPGIEIRTRNLNLEATGRMERQSALSATGWRTDADSLNVTLNLPPGWRLFALFGADWVRGDWLTAWTLLDLFLLLIFTLAVFRLHGFGAAVLAFLAFGLSHHEPDAPRYLWLALLIPIALLRVVPGGWGRTLLRVGKWATLAALVLVLVPFIVAQVQQTLYPQLEMVPRAANPFVTQSAGISEPMAEPADQSLNFSMEQSPLSRPAPMRTQKAIVPSPSSSNLLYDDKARIQTGPGVPNWSWRTVTFGWNGPVQAAQTIRPILISLTMERLLSIFRVALLLALVAVLLRRRIPPLPKMNSSAAAMLLAGWFFLPASPAQAQFPDESMLNTLRDRLLAPSDAYPNAADIPSASLTLQDRHLVIEARIHTEIETAVPLPARISDWSPLAVTVDGQPGAVLRRADGLLWIVLSPGVHTIRMEGLLPEVSEWEWTFQLKPRQVTVTAPDWTVSGVRPDGVPEAQVFFVRQQKSEAGTASYDRQDLHPLVIVDRHLELGLVWQVRTTVTRLSPKGKAIALRIPILAGENVLTSQIVIREGRIDANLGAQEESFSWQSELTPVNDLALTTQKSDPWIERWHLVASPVWNVALSGLAPVFEPGNPALVPVWHPWPGENVALTISRPEAIEGSTVTVNSGTHAVALGHRQRTSQLDLSIRSSLGEDFLVELPENAQVTTLSLNGQTIPVRKDGHKIIAPLRPGEQTLTLGWKTDLPLGWKASADAVRLPVESANIETSITVPENRWVLGTSGPPRGPAVRFWSVLVCSLLAAWALGRIPFSPLRTYEWMLLALGLTQVPLPAALLIVAWLFFLVLRGRESCIALPPLRFNLVQIALTLLTVIALGIFVAVVGAGLLGDPQMFILGNGSSRTFLRWYLPQSEPLLPQPGCFTVSLWWYRLLMLAWALWLAVSLLRWLRWGWDQFSKGGCFRRKK